eukprot:3332429-Pleurochrysis_carterae.AAC.1
MCARTSAMTKSLPVSQSSAQTASATASHTAAHAYCPLSVSVSSKSFCAVEPAPTRSGVHAISSTSGGTTR